MNPVALRETTPTDRDWVRALLRENWGGTEIVTRGRIHHADQLPGFIAWTEERPVGLITYRCENNECEIVTVDALERGKGIGSALVKTVVDRAAAIACSRVWLITTNDNTCALRFYQKLGFEFVAIHRGAISISRQLKPTIPEHGFDGIPILDEIELEKRAYE